MVAIEPGCCDGLLQRIRAPPHQHHLPTFTEQGKSASFTNAGTSAGYESDF
jgi:hypothetical protein